MDRLREFLKIVADQGVASGNLLGLLHIMIGRKISLPDGSPVSSGLSWRDLAALLKKLRWDPSLVSELGIDPGSLPPRDRERYWYSAIAQAPLRSPEAVSSGDHLRDILLPLGYIVSPAPSTVKDPNQPN